MDFRNLLQSLDQLNEATEKTKAGITHTSEPGGYGRKFDVGADASDEPKKKRGGQEKDEGPKAGKDAPKGDLFGRTTGKAPAGKKGTVHSKMKAGDKAEKDAEKAEKKEEKKKSTLKDWFDQLDKEVMNETGITVKPMQGASQIIGADGKPMGTADMATANVIKAASEKGTLKLDGEEQMEEGEMDEDFGATAAIAGGAALGTALGAVKGRYDDMKHMEKDDSQMYNRQHKPRTTVQRLRAAAGIPSKNDPNVKTNEEDIGKHNNATTGFDALVRKLTPKYGVEAAKRIAGSQLKKIKEAERPENFAQASPLSGTARSNVALESKKAKSDDKADKKKCPPMSHVKKMCKDGMSVAEICKMHPDCDQKELKQMVADCKKTLDEASMPMKKVDGKSVPAFAADGKGKNDLKKKKVKEGMEHHLKAAYHEGKSHGLSKMPYNCRHDNMEEAKQYHEGYKCGLDECYGQMPIQGYVGEMNNEVENMASYGARTPAMEDDMYEMDKTSYMKQQAAKTSGDTFKAFGQTFNDNDVLDEFAFEALDNQLNALLESDNKVSEGMTVSISKGQQGAPDSVSVSAQDGEADQLLSIIKSAGLGLFGGEEQNGYGAPQGGNSPGGISVVDDHDGMMALMKKIAGGGEEVSGGDYEDEEGHGDEHGHEETCESCGGMMEAGHACSEGQEMVDEVESEDQQLYNVAEDNPPDSGADNTNADVAGQVGSDEALAKADAGQDEEEGKIYSSPTNEDEDETGEEAGKEEMKERMSESSFFSLYKKLAMLSEESTSEKDDKAEKAAKKVAKDIEYDEGHKGKDDDKAEEAGKKVKKDIEYDDKKDKKEKIDEWANDAGPGKSVSDTTFETDIDFMMNIISGGLNKRKSTGQSTIPILANQVNRTVSQGTTDISESKMLNESVSDWKKLAGI
jgi:hypothetical protein